MVYEEMLYRFSVNVTTCFADAKVGGHVSVRGDASKARLIEVRKPLAFSGVIGSQEMMPLVPEGRTLVVRFGTLGAACDKIGVFM